MEFRQPCSNLLCRGTVDVYFSPCNHGLCDACALLFDGGYPPIVFEAFPCDSTQHSALAMQYQHLAELIKIKEWIDIGHRRDRSPEPLADMIHG